MSRVGLFGGTFDPPHLGHLALAEWAREQLELDRVLFVPAGRPPHKRRGDLSSAEARLAMTRLAVRGHRSFEVSTLETRRGGPSFTVDTLRGVARRRPGAQLFLIVGDDSLDDFHRWHEPREILRLATLAVASRPGGHTRSARKAFPRGRMIRLDNPPIALSSSAIRARVRSGRSVRYLVPDAVASLIERRRLYRKGR